MLTATRIITTPMITSSTRQVAGRAMNREADLAPKPSPENQTIEAPHAPTAKYQRWSPYWFPMEPTSRTVSRYTWGLRNVNASVASTTDRRDGGSASDGRSTSFRLARQNERMA